MCTHPLFPSPFMVSFFYCDPRDPLSSRRLSLRARARAHSTQAQRFYLRHQNSSFLHIYYLTPGSLGAGFCVYYVVDSLSSLLGIFLLGEKEGEQREKKWKDWDQREVQYTRDCVLFFFFCTTRFFSRECKFYLFKRITMTNN